MKKLLIVFFSTFILAFSLLSSPWPEKSRTGPEPPPLIPKEVLFGNPVTSSPRLSPDGDHLAFLAPSEKGVMNVWIRPLEKNDAVQVTRDSVRGIKTFFWTADGGGILYLQDTNGDENFHVLFAGLKNKLIRDLTPFQGIRAINLIPLKSEILVGLNLRKRQLFDIYRVDLETGAIRLDTENPGDVPYLTGNEWTADSSGVIRVIRTMDFKNGSTVLRVRDGQARPWRELDRWPNGGLFDGDIIGFDTDGAALWVTSSTEKDTTGIVKIDLLTGREIERVFDDPRCDIYSGDVLFNPKSRAIQAFVLDYQRREWKVVDSGIASDFEILKKSGRGFFRIIDRDARDSKWIVTYQPEDGAASTFVYDRKTGQIQFLFDDRPEIKKYILAPMKPLIITSRDGFKLASYLTLPVGLAPKNLPLVLFVHGGPTARDECEYDPLVQLLANRGYAVLQVNFRGSVGFGKTFQRAGDRQIGIGAMQDDLTDAVQWAIREGIADPKRIGIFGGSYGGYAVLAGLAFTPELYACGADICGPSHIKTVLESIPAYFGPIKDLMIRIFGDAEKDAVWDRKISPLFHVDRIKAPLLIGQGANDPRCNIRESDQIVKAMRDKNLPVTYVVYSDEGHGFVRPENKLDFAGRLEEFLAGHLGGRCEPHRKIEGSSAELR